MSTLLERASVLAPDLVAVRRDLHRHPELAFREVRTAGIVAERLEALGYTVRRGVGITGVVGELPGEAGQPVVALRADMDALPIQETNDFEYRSSVPGVMHACGHDAHTAMLLTGARLLAELRASGALGGGTVRLLFQPSEESSDEQNKSGAMRMVDDGALDGVAAIFGLHIGAHLEAGKAFLLQAGPIMAGTDTFRAHILGRGAHAARANEGVDAVLLAAHVVLAAQSIVSRRLSPLEEGVLHIGQINGGTAENILADHVELRGTLRYFEPQVRETIHAELKRVLAMVTALGGGTELELRPGYPPVRNDARMVDIARHAVGETLGAHAFGDWAPWMGAEDFAVLQQYAPGCFFWLGAALPEPREHHTPRFDVDERVLPLGAAALAACAVHALRELAP